MRIAATCDGAMIVGKQRLQDREARRRRRLLVAVELGVGRRERGEVHAGQQRLVAGPVVEARRGHARRAERPPVERAPEGDDPGPAGDPPGELEGAVDGLGARVQEQDRVERVRERVGEHPGEPDRRLREAHRVHRAHEPVDLGVDAAVTRGWAWPSAVTAIPFAKSRYSRPAVSYRRWPTPWRPAAVHVAAEDRRDVGAARGRRGRARDRRSCSSAEYREGAGRSGPVCRGSGDAAAGGGRIGGDRSRGPRAP